jgi:hypothetical protein
MKEVAEAWSSRRGPVPTKHLRELLDEWLPRLQPTPQPLPPWALLAARSGDIENCLLLFGRGVRLLGPKRRKELEDSAIQACAVFRRRREYLRVRQVIAAAGFTGLEQAYREALTSAVRGNRAQALLLLEFAAAHKPWTKDKDIAGLAVRLAERYCGEGKYRMLREVDDAYHTPRLADVYAKAVNALRRTTANERRTLDLLREAHRRFGNRHEGLASAAAALGAYYSRCENEGDHRWVREAHAAYPSMRHLPNLSRALVNLLAKPRYDQAGEIFAYARAHLGPDPGMARLVRETLETRPAEDDLVAFMGQLAGVAPQLAGRPDELAVWRLELARYHLLAENDLAAGQVYKRAYDEKAKAARSLRAEAMLRHGLLRALGDNRGDLAAANDILKALLKVAEKNSRQAVLAAAVLDRKLLLDDDRLRRFKLEASKLKVSRAEVELTLAANASLSRDAAVRATKSARLASAYKIITQDEKSYAWPYELIRFKQEAALRRHG